MSYSFEEKWCCLSCNSMLRLGHLIVGRHYLECPHCRGGNVHPAGGETIHLTEYHGEIGPLQ